MAAYVVEEWQWRALDGMNTVQTVLSDGSSIIVTKGTNLWTQRNETTCWREPYPDARRERISELAATAILRAARATNPPWYEGD